jgi:hemerythrin-like domain-containing protein
VTITEVLVAEHAVLCGVFDQIERVWPQVNTIHEIRLLAALVEGLLRQHGAKEENVLLPAYDHTLENRGQLQRLSQEHDEIDKRLLLIQQAATVTEAKSLLRATLARARNHFQFEERSVFPAIAQTLQPGTLQQLVHGISAQSPSVSLEPVGSAKRTG